MRPLANWPPFPGPRLGFPDEKLARLTLAARAADGRWEDIAAACGTNTCKDLTGVVYRITGETSAELLLPWHY